MIDDIMYRRPCVVYCSDYTIGTDVFVSFNFLYIKLENTNLRRIIVNPLDQGHD